MRNRIRVLLIGLCLVVPVIMLGCSLDDDAGPTEPGGGTGNNRPGGGGGQAFDISVTANPPVIEANGSDLSRIVAVIRSADTGRRVPNGTAVTMHTTLGSLNTDGGTGGAPTIRVFALNGRADAYLVAGERAGTAVVTASVVYSEGSVEVVFTEPPPDETPPGE